MKFNFKYFFILILRVLYLFKLFFMKVKIIVAVVLLIFSGFVVLNQITTDGIKKEKQTVLSSQIVDTDLSFLNKSNRSIIEKNINYFVRGANNKTIKKSKLLKAYSLEDIIEHFPTSWISEYISIEISRNRKGEIIKELSKNLFLTAQQKILFKNTAIGDEVLIKIAYKSKNAVTDKDNTSEANIKMTVFPESTASFKGKENELQNFFINNSSEEISNWKFKPLESAIATFVINELGEVSDVKVTSSTGIISLDASIIELLYKMPNWLPAKNYKGESIKQSFEFVLGDSGC